MPSTYTRAAYRLPAGLRLLAKLGLLVAATLLPLLLLELGLRLFDYQYTPLSIRQLRSSLESNRNDARMLHSFKDEHFVFDPDLIWRPKRGHGVFNSLGYRGEAVPAEKAKGELRILAVGDSNTLGWDGKDGPNWPRYLEELARADRPATYVMNVGVWGYTSFQGLRRFRESLALQPDVVLISFGSNDAHVVAVSDSEFVARAFAPPGGSRIVTLVRAAADRLATRRTGGPALTQHRVGLAEYEENLRAMVTESRSRGAVPLLLTRPYTGESNDALWWKSFAPQYTAATRKVGQETGTRVVDLFEEFKARPEVFADESHFTEEGHREAAKVVYEAIKGELGGRPR